MIAIDTETTGLDLRHGARPFFVTTCRPDGVQTFYEWDVDPYTREVSVPPEDVAELNALLASGEELVGHNVKFDATALQQVGVGPWPWERTHDTTLLAHLLASNQPRNLTDVAMLWLGKDILPLETRLHGVVKKARTLVGQNRFKDQYGEWVTAREGLPGLPTSGTRAWMADYWLPRAVAVALGYPVPDEECRHEWVGDLCERCGGHLWHVALRYYANEDSGITVALYSALRREVDRRGRTGFYEAQRPMVRVGYEMESRGLTTSDGDVVALEEAFRESSDQYGAECLSIASARGYELSLPRNGVNGSLRTFCFDVLELEPVRNPKARTDAPCLDAKNAFPHYLATLPDGSDQRRFIESLLDKRARDTGLQYLEAYRRYRRPLEEYPGWYVVSPSYNVTGTDTVRLSSDNPNGQQISAKEKANVRRVFGPAPGREWWSLDFKNIELRIPAYEAEEQDLIALFEDGDAPPFYGSEHLLNFSVVYPDVWADAVREAGLTGAGALVKERYKSTWYKRVKNGDFAVGYGAGPATADKAFGRPGCHALLKQRFAGKEELNRRCIAYAEQYGYVETLPDRTVDPTRGYPLMTTRGDYGRVKPTVPLNYRVQGTAGWVGNRAAVRCLEQLDEWNRGRDAQWFMPCYVHDELVFDFPRRAHPLKDRKRSNWGRVQVLRRLMERGGEDLVPRVPTLVSVEYHDRTWAEGVKC